MSLLFLEIGKFLWSVIGGIFSRDGFASMRSNWRNIAMVGGLALGVLALIWLVNPFDDSARERRLADAKAERTALLQCSVETLKGNAKLVALQADANRAAKQAADDARDEADKELRTLRAKNADLEDRLRALPDRPGISARALKELAR